MAGLQIATLPEVLLAVLMEVHRLPSAQPFPEWDRRLWMARRRLAPTAAGEFLVPQGPLQLALLSSYLLDHRFRLPPRYNLVPAIEPPLLQEKAPQFRSSRLAREPTMKGVRNLHTRRQIMHSPYPPFANLRHC
jgi:hypothetical protein